MGCLHSNCSTSFPQPGAHPQLSLLFSPPTGGFRAKAKETTCVLCHFTPLAPSMVKLPPANSRGFSEAAPPGLCWAGRGRTTRGWHERRKTSPWSCRSPTASIPREDLSRGPSFPGCLQGSFSSLSRNQMQAVLEIHAALKQPIL